MNAQAKGRWVRIGGAILGVAGLGGVIYIALRSSPYLSELPGLQNGLGRWIDTYGVARNIVAFGAVGLVLLSLLPHRQRSAAAVGLGGLGIALELAQLAIPTRVCDWRDMVASVAGVALAWALVGLAGRLRRAGRSGE